MLGSRGFTLVELMIAVAVVALLATMAYPSYQEHVHKARRSEVQSVMLEMVAKQHQRLLDVRRYLDSGSPADLGVSVPEGLSRFYTVSTNADNTAKPPSFTVTATPKDSQVRDRCGTLSMNQVGQRSAKVGDAPVSGCW